MGMSMFTEIEDPKQIGRLQRLLRTRIKRAAPYAEQRTIGYPTGRFGAVVNFINRTGESIWWSSTLADSKTHWINLIGRGTPGEADLLMIDLQFNMIEKTFHRRLGGTFVRENDTQLIFIAHRGIVTRGKSRVPWDRLISLTTERAIPVSSSRGATDMFLVAALDSKSLLIDMAQFAQEIRDSLDRVSPKSSAGIVVEGQENQTTDLFETTLRDFFEEFSGKRKIPKRQATMAIVKHGSVVKALKKLILGLGEARNSRSVDLCLSGKGGEVHLFEVKTSTDTTSLYTGIGQLFMHSVGLTRHFGRRRINKILVLPGLPSLLFRQRLRQEMGVDVLTYFWGQDGSIEFEPIATIGL